MPEFIEHPPCCKKVFQTGTNKLLGYCVRREDHTGRCSHLINDRITHNLRWPLVR